MDAAPHAPVARAAGGHRLTWQGIYRTVRRVPRGRVITYGRVAALAGIPGRARQVGYALHALKDGTTVPWHRVINARGGISLRGHAAVTQRIRLEHEGVRFDAAGRIDLARFGWALERR